MVDALKSAPVFEDLDPAALRRLAASFERVLLPGGKTLFREGDAADAVYVLTAGRLRVTSENGGTESRIAEVGPGEVVGETALLSRGGRTATVLAIRDCDLLRLGADAFDRAVRSHPDVLLRIVGTLAARAATPTTARAAVRTVAVVAAGGGGVVPLRGFARSLAQALAKHGRARVVSRRTVERALGKGAADGGNRRDEGPIVAWLHDVEDANRFVVYEAGADADAWTGRCIRQADLVLHVGLGGSDPRLGPVEEMLIGAGRTHARRELVLVWSSGAPRATAEWLRHRGVAAHHHICSPPDIDRLARFVAGRAVGLVLGGGGARGMAHLGVLRALERAGVPIDAIGGTSIGAIMAAGYAMGWDDATRVENVIDAFVKTRMLVGPTLPLVSLSSSKKITRLLSHPDYLGDTQIEDMPNSFFCLSANLSTHEEVLHTRGPAWLAVRASASLPGVLPPVWMDGNLLVDGGVVNDVPVRPMRRIANGPVLACDIMPDVDLRIREPIEPTLSGWKVLARKLSPFSPSLDVPNALEVIMRAKEVGGRRAQLKDLASAPADLLLRPPTGDVSALDFKAGTALIETADRYASAQLDAWPRTAELTSW